MPLLMPTRPMRITVLAALMLIHAVPADADDYLMYGPSLAVWLEENLLTPTPDLRGCRAVDAPPSRHHGHGHATPSTKGPCGVPFTSDESTFTIDAGHTVTIVDEDEWLAMTTEDFAAFDAIVIGDAGCKLDDGTLLDPVNATKAIWSPAVTGNLFVHTLDPIFHFNRNDAGGPPRRGPVSTTTPEQFQAMVDLTVEGIDFAASADGTGLYYAHACRIASAFDFLSLLTSLTDGGGGNDEVAILEADHPAMLLLTDDGLSSWSNSYHSELTSLNESVSSLAGNASDPDRPSIIAATREPIGDVIVFTDDFESGTTDRWSATTGAGSP